MDTNRPEQLNPCETPLCAEYMKLFVEAYSWQDDARILRSHPNVQLMAQKKMEAMIAHRATCPLCRKRMEERNEIERKAEYPEVKE